VKRDWSRDVGDVLAPHMRRDFPAARTPHHNQNALDLVGTDTSSPASVALVKTWDVEAIWRHGIVESRSRWNV